MPALDHGDFHLYETDAILRYLDTVLPMPSMIPAEPHAAARMAQLIGMTNSYIAPRISGAISFQRRIAPMLGLPTDEEALAAALPDADHCLGEIAALMGAAPFMAGDSLSLADCMVAPHLSFLREFDEGRTLLAAHPTLAAWIERIEARPSMRTTTWERLLALTGIEFANFQAA